MIQSKNPNIESQSQLSSPDRIKTELPLTSQAYSSVLSSRTAIQDILNHNDSRHLMIVGPCSIHDVHAALAYAKCLKKLSNAVADRILLVMRLYFEKPRTSIGWKGLIYDPNLNGTCNVETGLRLTRKLLLEIIELGLPAATEILDPIIPQYIIDLISWAAVGARTTQSQTHRQLASGLPMPVGFKNAPDGNVQVAVDSIKTARCRHTFIGVNRQGHAAVFRSQGNRSCHLVLRGGRDNKPNYGSTHVKAAKKLMVQDGLVPNIMIDCSHDNSCKDPEKQIIVMHDILKQLNDGKSAIIGTMLESNLETGKQSITSEAKIEPGISITDACLGWEETESLIRTVYDSLPS